MTWLFVMCGVVCIVAVLFDVVTTLFASTGRAGISQRLIRRFWQLLGPLLQRSIFARTMAGPMTFVAVVMFWVGLTVVGWALIYWPFLPGSFLIDFGIDREPTAGTLVAAIYLSMVAMTTLGFGDIVPSSAALRLIVPLEGFIGLGLLTASISWFLSIDPVLSRRRALAHRVTLLREVTGSETGLVNWGEKSREEILDDLAAQLIVIRTDLAQFPVTYYFRDTDERANLARSLPYLVEITRAERHDPDDHSAGVQGSAEMLQAAITDYLKMVRLQFLDNGDATREESLERYLREHR